MEPTERHQLLVHWKIRYIFLISKRQFALRFFQILYLYDLYWYVLFYICTYIFIYFNSAVREKKFSFSDFFFSIGSNRGINGRAVLSFFSGGGDDSEICVNQIAVEDFRYGGYVHRQ